MKNRAEKIYIVVSMIIILVIVALMLTACGEVRTGNRIVGGKDVQSFSYAYVRLGDKDIVEGYVTQWRDYENSDVVQVLIDGKYYLTHYSCVVLVADPRLGIQYDSGLVDHN